MNRHGQIRKCILAEVHNGQFCEIVTEKATCCLVSYRIAEKHVITHSKNMFRNGDIGKSYMLAGVIELF